MKPVYRAEYTPWRIELRRKIAAHLWHIAAPARGVWPAADVEALLTGFLDVDCVSSFLRAVSRHPPDEPHELRTWQVDQQVPDERRKQHGVFFTPEPLAHRMAMLIDGPTSVLDLAAGSGELLVAISKRFPGAELHAIEFDPDIATVCAARAATHGLNMKVYCGDGLGDIGPERVDVVVINPPYLGEKGNAETFARLRSSHAHLAAAFAPRTDLANLFVYRSLQRLNAGGRLIALTSEYWLQSDSATVVREKIREEFAVKRFERFGAGIFPDAPGHHTLITVVDCGVQGDIGVVDDGGERSTEPGTLDSIRWNPFVADATKSGVPLGEIVRTSQGFVSGADRLTKRHIREFGIAGEPGEPIFMFDERPAGPLSDLVEPVLRGSQLCPDAVFDSFEPICWALYIDHELPVDSAAVRYLEKFRPILERRREARTGAMPWYRMHWPRDRSAMARPKLVTPRRAAQPCFALDLTGSVVSSDCTFIVAPPETVDETAFLEALMGDLNSPESFAWLKRHGKMKGELLEFYAGPLEALPVDRESLFSTG